MACTSHTVYSVSGSIVALRCNRYTGGAVAAVSTGEPQPPFVDHEGAPVAAVAREEPTETPCDRSPSL